jgi:hypothetical protein
MGTDTHVPGCTADRAVEHVAAVQVLRRFGLARRGTESSRCGRSPKIRAARETLDDLPSTPSEELHPLVRLVIESEHGDHQRSLCGDGWR